MGELTPRQEREIERKERLQEAIARVPPNDLETWKNRPKAEKQRIYIALAYFGATTREAALYLGITEQAISWWLHHDYDRMHELMMEGFNSNALLEVPKSFHTLRGLRDFSENEETKRKAALNLLAAAHVHLESPDGKSGVTVNLTGENNQFNLLSVRDIDDRLDQLAKELGPGFQKLLNEERGGDASRGSPGPAPGTSSTPETGPA